MVPSELQIRMSVKMQHWARGWMCSSPRSSLPLPVESGVHQQCGELNTAVKADVALGSERRGAALSVLHPQLLRDARYDQWLLALHVIVISAKGGFVFPVCLCVCLSDWKITEKVINRFWWNFQELLIMVQGTDGHILIMFQITILD